MQETSINTFTMTFLSLSKANALTEKVVGFHTKFEDEVSELQKTDDEVYELQKQGYSSRGTKEYVRSEILTVPTRQSIQGAKDSIIVAMLIAKKAHEERKQACSKDPIVMPKDCKLLDLEHCLVVICLKVELALTECITMLDKWSNVITDLRASLTMVVTD